MSRSQQKCSTILMSGKRKGKKCNRKLPCPYHSIEENKDETEEIIESIQKLKLTTKYGSEWRDTFMDKFVTSISSDYSDINTLDDLIQSEMIERGVKHMAWNKLARSAEMRFYIMDYFSTQPEYKDVCFESIHFTIYGDKIARRRGTSSITMCLDEKRLTFINCTYTIDLSTHVIVAIINPLTKTIEFFDPNGYLKIRKYQILLK